MESPNRAEENLKTFFSNLSQEYGEKQAKSILDPILEEYGKNEDSKNRHVQASAALQRSDMRPTQRLAAQQQLNDMEKLNIERDKALNLKVNKEILRDKALNKQATQAKDAYDIELQKKGAAETAELEKKIPAYNNTLSDIDEMERLSKEYLGGAKGYIKGVLGTQAARELDTLGASALDPIIKKFNPAGTLPTAKLNWIRQTFSPTASENPSGRQGKINNLRRFTKQSKKKDEERLRLLKEYRGIIPIEIAKQFEEAESAELSAFADEISLEDKIRDLNDDDPVYNMYDQKGEKLGPIPKKEAVKLFEQGLITNVP
jgi:hypothetical protein